MCDDRRVPTSRICDTCLGKTVNGALQMNGRLRADQLGVLVQAGNVSLHGELPTYHEKQMAQQIAMSIDEVGRVCNEIFVRPPSGDDRCETGA